MNPIKELKERAKELKDFGNSKEQAEGHGIDTAIEELEKYYKGFNILMCYFDSISDEEKLKVNKKLTKLGL